MTNTVETVAQSMPISEEQKQQVTAKADEVKNQVRGQVTKQVGDKASQVGDQASSIASALRSSSQQLQDQGQTGPAKVMDMAAERTDQLGYYLSSTDPNQILADAEDFCRQRPWVVIAGGAALGFLAARFLKASSSRRYSERYDTTPGQLGRLPSGDGYNGQPYRPADIEPYQTGGV